MGTLINMPNVARLKMICRTFGDAHVYYYGSIGYLMPLISRFLGEKVSARISNAWDVFFRVKRSAFRFVLVARSLNKKVFT